MSKSIAVVAAGAPAALLQAASAMISKATGGAVKASEAAVAEKSAVVVGSQAPRGAYACVAQPSASASPAYKGVQSAVVRAVAPRAAVDRLQVRDAVDIYPAAGINCDAEIEAAEEAFTKAAEVAVQKAKELKCARITLSVKHANKYKQLNDLFERTVTAKIEGSGMQVERMATARVANDLVMFPERHTVVLTNDDPVNENIQLAYAGAVGGVPLVYHTAQGTVHGGYSYKTVALAVAEELKAMGMKAEASKIEAAAAKDPMNVAKAI